MGIQCCFCRELQLLPRGKRESTQPRFRKSRRRHLELLLASLSSAVLCPIFHGLALALFSIMKGSPDAIIFDCDGTLVDTETPYMQALNMAVYELSDGKSQGVTSREIWGRNYSGKGLEYDSIQAVEQFGLSCSHAEFLVLWQRRMTELISEPRSIALNDGFDELYAHAREKGLKIAVASSSDRNGLRLKLTNGLLSHSRVVKGLEDFDLILSNDEVTKHKPDPEIYLLAAELLGTSPETCLVVEDTATGVLAGKRAGMRVVAVPNDYTRSTNDFSEAHHVVRTLRDVIAIL